MPRARAVPRWPAIRVPSDAPCNPRATVLRSPCRSPMRRSPSSLTLQSLIPVRAVAPAARMPAALSMPAASIPRRGAGSRSVASSTMTPVHSPIGRSLSAGCSGWPTHRPPCSSSRRRLSWCRSRTGPSTPVSRSLRLRSQPSRSTRAARSPCQATSRVLADGGLIARPGPLAGCWRITGLPAACSHPVLHGVVSVRLDPEENLPGLCSSCSSHLAAHASPCCTCSQAGEGKVRVVLGQQP